MSFAAPLWLAVAAVVGAGVIIAHLFSTSVPPRDFLPTVRFVPEGAPMAVLRTRRLSDVILLLLRLLAVALIGFALAGAHVKRGGPGRVVLVDASRAVRSFTEVRDSARGAVSEGGGAMLIAFDSSARRLSRDALDTMEATEARGSLSAGLVAAHRALAGGGVTDGREQTELVVVSPAVAEQIDAATARLLALWSGPVRRVRVAAAEAPVRRAVVVRATGDDPIAALIVILRGDAPKNLLSESRSQHAEPGVRVIRSNPTRADSAWARDSGGVLLIWPADLRGSALVRRAAADTQNAVVAGSSVVVASFARTHQPRPGRTIARWIDGEAAASEASLGRGCIREVAIPVDPVGDVALRASFRGVVGTLTEPCGGARDFATDSVILRHAVPKDLLSTNKQQGIRSAQDNTARVIGVLLAALAIAVLIAEQLLRARVRTAS